MKRTLLSIIGILTSFLLVGSAAAKDYMKLGNVTVPSTFCTTTQSGSTVYRGVRLYTAIPYAVWLPQNALGSDRLDEMVKTENTARQRNGQAVMTLGEESEFRHQKTREEATFQMKVGVQPGQDKLCPLVK